jgi:hypothetical protein
MFWIAVSAMATTVAVLFARRVDSTEGLWVKHAFYLSAVCFLAFGGYNYYQWEAGRSAPEQIQEHLPVYPAAHLKSRVPVEHFALVERLFGVAEEADEILGKWIFETSDSAMEVGRYYQRWVRRWKLPAEVDLGTDYSSVLISSSDYIVSVTAKNHWGRTGITYTLMNPVS